MVPAEVLAELQPFCQLAQGLGTAAVQLVGSHGFTDIHITYATSRGGAPWDPKTPSDCTSLLSQPHPIWQPKLHRHPHHLRHQPRRCAPARKPEILWPCMACTCQTWAVQMQAPMLMLTCMASTTRQSV